MIGGKPGAKGQSGSAPDYRRVFICRVHQLLQLGYNTMTPSAYTKHEEPEITGELVRAMDEVIDERPRAWLRHFSVHDDPPVNAPDRLGKSRRRVDIKVVSGQRSPRSRFSFEAKCLSKSHPVGIYLGPKGLGCFLTGDYARDEDGAGMLGYVQSESAEVWAGKLEETLEQAGNKHGVCNGFTWRACPLKGGPKYTFRTRHERPALKRRVDIYHTLLTFC